MMAQSSGSKPTRTAVLRVQPEFVARWQLNDSDQSYAILPRGNGGSRS